MIRPCVRVLRARVCVVVVRACVVFLFYCFCRLLVPEAMDFESPFSTFRVLSSTMVPLPVNDISDDGDDDDDPLAPALVVSSLLLLLLSPPTFFLFVPLPLFATAELTRMHSMNRSWDLTRCRSNNSSTDGCVAELSARLVSVLLLDAPSVAAVSAAKSAAALAFLRAMWSSMRFRSFVFSSRSISKDCSSVDVKDFLRRRLFLACLRFRSLRWNTIHGKKSYQNGLVFAVQQRIWKKPNKKDERRIQKKACGERELLANEKVTLDAEEKTARLGQWLGHG